MATLKSGRAPRGAKLEKPRPLKSRLSSDPELTAGDADKENFGDVSASEKITSTVEEADVGSGKQKDVPVALDTEKIG